MQESRRKPGCPLKLPLNAWSHIIPLPLCFIIGKSLLFWQRNPPSKHDTAAESSVPPTGTSNAGFWSNMPALNALMWVKPVSANTTHPSFRTSKVLPGLVVEIQRFSGRWMKGRVYIFPSSLSAPPSRFSITGSVGGREPPAGRSKLHQRLFPNGHAAKISRQSYQ